MKLIKASHIVSSLSALLLQGCISSAILEAPQEFIHQIDYVLNGTEHSVKTRLSCTSSTSYLSAADGFRNRWDIKGDDQQALIRFGDNAAFLYHVTATCNQKGAEQNIYATVLEDLSNPSRFRRIIDRSELVVGNNTIRIARIFSRRATPDDAGVQFAGVGEKPELINYRKRTYARVTAYVLNENAWGKDPKVREYLSQLTQLTASTSLSFSDEKFSEFPISNRIRGYSPNDSVRMGAIYRDGEFIVGEQYSNDYIWYAIGVIDSHNSSPPKQVDWVNINYKGNKLRVKNKLELFDPTKKQFVIFLRNQS